MIDDLAFMERAVANAARIRHSTSPNPWVGVVIVALDGQVFDGATEPPGGRHAVLAPMPCGGGGRRSRGLGGIPMSPSRARSRKAATLASSSHSSAS